MKRFAFIFVTLATVFVTSCVKENRPVDNGKTGKAYTLRASIEDPASKATLSGTSLLWSSGDKIGVYVNDASWTDKNQPFTLDGDGGSATGDFKWDNDGGNFTNQNASAAFFPWNGTGDNVNNVYDGTMYFKMTDAYTDYTSGKMLVPLVAKMTYNSETEEYDDLAFKYVGGVVRVSISNVPGAAHSLGMTVPGKNVHEDFSVNPAEAGTAAWASTDGNNSTIWLNMATADADRAFDFVFPVPTLNSPTLTFQMYDKNDVLIWKRTASNQPSIDRAGMLDFSGVEINAVPREMYLTGNINGVDVNDTSYKFKTNKNGGASLSLTLTADSYVNLTCSGTTFWTNGWLGTEVTSATMAPDYSSEDKLYVPAGEVEFTVTYNTDGTLNLSYISYPHHDYVDLGLSVMWATMNVGASSETDYGDYFAWGETTTKSNYIWDTYLYGTQDDLTKYNSIDGLTILDSGDDAATANWGGTWRMPTDDEWTALRTYCNWTWKTTDDGYAHNGYLVKASNGNSIFLPAAGYWASATLFDDGSVGRYWSSSLNTSSSNSAWYVFIYSSRFYRDSGNRFYGRSVRPVYDPQ